MTYRRELLDQALFEIQPAMEGIILDVGGKKTNKRGAFQPDLTKYKNQVSWLYLNMEIKTCPDIYGDAHKLPVKSESIDCVVCCEVLEHVADPFTCCAEIYRILKPGGLFVFSVPFIFPIHADPYDFGRFTPERIRLMCKDFKSTSSRPMGAWLGTIGLLIELSSQEINKNSIWTRQARKLVNGFGSALIALEKKKTAGRFDENVKLTTGYFCTCYK
jgi:Methylase involved in ubiquinone/menaquinone biosynthesis